MKALRPLDDQNQLTLLADTVTWSGYLVQSNTTYPRGCKGSSTWSSGDLSDRSATWVNCLHALGEGMF